MLQQTTGERTLTIAGQTAKVSTWQRAYGKARAEGVKVYRRNGEWLASSVSEPNALHVVNGKCDCRAAERGLVCKHLVAVRSAQLRVGELAVCDFCGTVGHAGREVAYHARWLGGHGLADSWHCVAGFGCANKAS